MILNKITVPFVLFVGALSAAFGAGGAYSLTKGQTKQNTEDVAALQKHQAKQDEQITDLRETKATLTTDVEWIKGSLTRIEERLGTRR